MKIEWPIVSVIAVVVVIIAGILIFQPRYQSATMFPSFSQNSVELSKAEYISVPVQSPSKPALSPILITPAAVLPAAETQSAEVKTIASVALPIKTSAASQSANVAASAKAGYAVQIGSFSNKEKAEAVLNNLKATGINGYISSADLAAKGVWYRINAGPFPSHEEAISALPQIKEKFKTGLVVKLSK